MSAAKLANRPPGRPRETAGITTVSQDAAGQMLNVHRSTVARAPTVISKGIHEPAALAERREVAVSWPLDRRRVRRRLARATTRNDEIAARVVNIHFEFS